MMEWKELNITEMCDTISVSYKGDANEVVLINTSDVLEGACLNHERVPNKNLKGQFKKTFQKDDILYSEIRPANKRFAYIDFDPKDYIASTKLMVLRAKTNVNPRFLYQILRSENTLIQLQTLAESRSGTFPQITYSELANVSYPLPPKEHQDKIVSILSSLDRKIELNNKINAQLEEMAQALFKSWFVDFEPFKDGKFVESELGMIPEGWRVGTLGDICETNLRSVKGKILSPVQYLDTGSITENVIDGYQYLDPAKDKMPSRAKRLVQEGDIVFSTVRPNQKHYGIILNPPSKLVVSTGFCVITSNWTGYTPYIYQFLKQDSIINKLQAIAEQSVSTYPSINASDIENLEIVIPVDKDIQVFAETLCTFNKRIAFLLAENLHLSQLRDTLLPKLMNGEIEL